MKLIGLSIAGPRSRELLQRLTDDDVSGESFKFMDYREMEVATVRAKVNRVTYTGDLGYEIWVAPEYQRRLYQSIMAAGADLGIRNFGMRALLCLRLEKNFGTWYREFRPIYGPFEAGLDRFVKLDKPDFIGRAAALKEKTEGPQKPASSWWWMRPTATSWAMSRSGSMARWWAGSPRAALATMCSSRWRRAISRPRWCDPTWPWKLKSWANAARHACKCCPPSTPKPGA